MFSLVFYDKDIKIVDFLCYKLYNISMNNTRLTFLEPTNFTVPITIFQTLVSDAFHFGYVKNDVANLSGLLNHLIPVLSDYREDLHLDFLLQNNGDEILTRKTEECIYKTYFRKYDFCDDAVVCIPFRINQVHYNDFLKIHDLLLPKYNMDFSNFVRSLLLEYTTKRLCQREYFFHYRLMFDLKNAISNQYLCHLYNKTERITLVPLSLECSKFNEQNFIVGVNEENDTFYAVPLADIQKVVVDENQPIHVDDDDYIAIQDFFEEYDKEDT